MKTKDRNYFYEVIKYFYDFIKKNFISINWYESSIGKKKILRKKGIKLIVLKSKKGINKLNINEYFEKYQFKLERFRKGINFLVLVNNKEFLSSGWIYYGREWSISEIQKNIILKKQYLLFDFETPHDVRKKGYYTLLLKLIRYKYKNKKLVIYTQSNNAASNKAIKKSGFKFVRKMYA